MILRDGQVIGTEETKADGTITVSNVTEGYYEFREVSAPAGFDCDRSPVGVHVNAEDLQGEQNIVVEKMNHHKRTLTIQKRDAETGDPIPGTSFHTVHVVQLEPNRTTTIELTNILKPTFKVIKVDSVTHSPIANVKFQIWCGSDDTITGELNDPGVFQTNASGEIVLEHIDTGWYRIKELEPAPGFTIKQPDTQDIYLKAGETHEVQFKNVPKNCIIVKKYDSVTGEALPGCTFQLRYLAGTSGTGGTVIGKKVTGKNGVAMWTGLEPGAYVLEEVDPADGYSIINSSETVYLADNGEQSVITVRFDNMPDGNLLIRKVCATNPSITLQNAEFKITYADGSASVLSRAVGRKDQYTIDRIMGIHVVLLSQLHIAQPFLPITSNIHPLCSFHFLTPFPGFFVALIGSPSFSLLSATKLHFFLGVFLHFITAADRDAAGCQPEGVRRRDADMGQGIIL